MKDYLMLISNIISRVEYGGVNAEENSGTRY